MGSHLFMTISVFSSLAYLTFGAVSVVPATVTDQHGNTANQFSQITFVDIPDSVTVDYASSPEDYSYNGLKPLFQGMHGFVNACFGKNDPFDLVLGLVDGSQAFSTDLILSLAKWGYGYGACIVVGLLFIFIFPIVGCCFCCCRTCCGNCGGKMVQKRDDNYKMWRACYIITLFISCTFLGCGMITTYVVNERMTTLFSDVSNTLTENVADFSRYANNTINEINYVAYDGFNFTARVMLRDLDNIGPIVGGSVQESFNQQAGIDDVFDQLLALDPLLKSMIDDLVDVKDTKTAIVTSITNLETAMTSVADDIDATFSTCGAPCDPAPTTETNQLRTGSNFDPSTMPNFDTELTDLQNVYAQNITALVLDGQKQFNNISSIVETEAASVVQSIKDMVGSFDSVISSALGSVTDMFTLFDSITNLTKPIENIEATVVAGSLTVGDIEQYRWMGGVGLTCFVLLILVLQLVGLILGCMSCCCCGGDKALPTERGMAGNCAGILLMASVGLVFIFGALICLLVWVTYLPGAPLEQLLCKNLRDPTFALFEDLIDGGDPANGPYSTILGSQAGYTLGEMVFQDNAVPLTVKGLLTDCANNEPAWKALYVGKFFDIDAVLDYGSTIDVNSQIDTLSVDLSTLTILDANTEAQITDMGDAIDLINFDGLITSLDVATVTADFSGLTSVLQGVVDSIGGNGALAATKSQLEAQIVEINRIENEEFAYVSGNQTAMLDTIKNLNATASTVPSTIDVLIDTLNTTQVTLQSNGEDIIKNESKAFAYRVLGIADQFVSFVNTTIQEELGRCKPVDNFYQSVLVNTVCGSVVDSLNGVWFTLGWCLFFMVFGIIFSTKLAKHVRRMKELHPEDQDYDQQPPSYENDEFWPEDKYAASGDSNYGPGKGKVHPI